MKATGIVRRIDDLGRIVIPKEIRRTLRIRETDPMEIFTNKEGEIVLKKYSVVGEIGEVAKIYAEALAQATGEMICIADRDRIIAASGSDKKFFLSKEISKELETLIDERATMLAIKGENAYINIVEQQDEAYVQEAVSSIICGGDVCGAVIMLSKNLSRQFDEAQKQMVLAAAGFLGKNMEA